MRPAARDRSPCSLEQSTRRGAPARRPWSRPPTHSASRRSAETGRCRDSRRRAPAAAAAAAGPTRRASLRPAQTRGAARRPASPPVSPPRVRARQPGRSRTAAARRPRDTPRQRRTLPRRPAGRPPQPAGETSVVQTVRRLRFRRVAAIFVARAGGTERAAREDAAAAKR